MIALLVYAFLPYLPAANWPLLLTVFLAGLCNYLHWSNVVYGGWRHFLDGFVATATVLFHEVWCITDFSINAEYQNAKFRLLWLELRGFVSGDSGSGAFGQVSNNTLRDHLSSWPRILAVVLLINTCCVLAYLAGWLAHAKQGVVHCVAVTQGM